jgi:hypothetical protein
MKISAEVSKYLIKFDSEVRGYPLSEKEIDYQMEVIRKNAVNTYTLINGDVINFWYKHWSVYTYENYRDSLKKIK